jgi:hypothetical protein
VTPPAEEAPAKRWYEKPPPKWVWVVLVVIVLAAGYGWLIQNVFIPAGRAQEETVRKQEEDRNLCRMVVGVDPAFNKLHFREWTVACHYEVASKALAKGTDRMTAFRQAAKQCSLDLTPCERALR